MNRRATVLGADSAGNLVLQLADAGLGTAPVPRPIVGSSTTGLHTVPPTGAQVLLLHEGEHMTPKPAAAVTASDTLGALPALSAGETVIYGPNQEVLSHAAASGPHTLFSNAAGTLSLKIDPATNRINLVCSGGLYVNGVAVSVP